MGEDLGVKILFARRLECIGVAAAGVRSHSADWPNSIRNTSRNNKNWYARCR